VGNIKTEELRKQCQAHRTAILGCVSDINEAIDDKNADHDKVDSVQRHLGCIMAEVQGLQAYYQEWKRSLRHDEQDKTRMGGQIHGET